MKRSKIATIIACFILATITFLSVSVESLAAIPEYAKEYEDQPSYSYNQKFNDVPKSYWAFNYIMEMTERGVISGYPNGYFYPNNTITRAEFAKVMCLAGGVKVNSVEYTSYNDVDIDSWYASYVEAGKYYLSGYISDGKKYYLPENNALREDIAVALVKLKGYDTSLYDESIIKTMFTDYQSISISARKYVSVAIEHGLISGYKDGTFRGQDSITRAEAATLLWRAYQYGNGNKIFEKEEFNTPIIDNSNLPTSNKPDRNYESDKDDSDQESTENYEEETESEYLYELKTIASNVSNVDSMISVDNGIVYLDNNCLYKVKKDSNKLNL